VGEASYKLCGENKWEPENPADALWNYRYSAAVALVKQNLFLDDFTESAIKDPKVLKLIPDIEIIPDASMGHRVEVVIQNKEGKSFSKVMDDMEYASIEEIVEKFKKCCRYSAKPFSDEKAEEFIEVVDKLEEVQDITEIMDILV
jgi:2-methylcitrate dehydratase PrpD